MSIRPALLLAILAPLLAAPLPAQGRWSVAFPEVKDPVHRELRSTFQELGLLHDLVVPLNEDFPPREDIVVEFTECGGALSFYAPARRTVRLCYELMMEVLGGDDDEDVEGGAFTFTMLHAIAQAMIAERGIDSPLPPERAADELATLMVAGAGDDAVMMARGVILLRDRSMTWQRGLPFTHERATDVLCLLHGWDPRGFAWIVGEGALDASRAAGCVAEAAQVAEVWDILLAEAYPGDG
jgi:hypothetical protein